MDDIEPLDVETLLSYLVQEITGIKDGSDTTIFLWDNASIHNTIPPTPVALRGSGLFRKIRHLPPKKEFTGTMQIHRQGGVIKNWIFEETI